MLPAAWETGKCQLTGRESMRLPDRGAGMLSRPAHPRRYALSRPAKAWPDNSQRLAVRFIPG